MNCVIYLFTSSQPLVLLGVLFPVHPANSANVSVSVVFVVVTVTTLLPSDINVFLPSFSLSAALSVILILVLFANFSSE